MLEHYSRILMDAERRALDAIARTTGPAIFDAGVRQNRNQLEVAGNEQAPNC
jgi:hypothetical protein